MKVKRTKKKVIKDGKKKSIKDRKGIGGRHSKIQRLDIKKIEKLAKHGCTEQQIADILGIHYTNFCKNKKKRVEIRYAIKRGLELGNKKVQGSLFKRANGFYIDAIHFSSYEGLITRTAYRKYYAPSDIAAFFWLKNKAGWKDKPDDIFDQQSVMALATKLVEIIVSESPTEKIKQKLLSRTSEAFEALQSKRTGADG